MEAQKIRRYDVDWLRVIVFAILIFYHIGMYFVPWGWHIKSSVTYEGLKWPMLFVNQWRLPILFIISGMGTRFALSYRSGAQFIKERLYRLGIPLLVGIAFIVPPQLYIERILHGEFNGSYISFYVTECFRGIYPEGNLSWHHLWFLPYLLLFSLILSPAFLYLRDHQHARLLRLTNRWLHKKNGLYAFTIPLILIEILVEPFFPITHALVGDWYAILLYSSLFMFGYLFISCQQEFWVAVTVLKKSSVYIGVIAFIVYIAIQTQLEDGLWVHIVEAAIKMINMWAWIIALFGYASMYLNRPGKVLSYCNEAVYPFYIVHQTVQVILCYIFIQMGIPIFLSFLLLTIGTFIFSWLLYEFIIRRQRILKPLFGLKN